MAALVPSLNSCVRRMQPGERRFARRLISHLEDDYLCWYDQPVGGRPRYADFIILHPSRGILLLEVKDWKLSTIHQLNKETAEIFTDRGAKTVPNPILQARQCIHVLVDRLQQEPQLVNQDGPYKGKLILPYGFGVVLSNITRQQFDGAQLSMALPEHQVICKDEMDEGVDPEEFQKRLWDMFNVQFRQRLTSPQIDRVRGIIFPELRVGEQSDLFGSSIVADSPTSVTSDVVKVMDRRQEQLARSLGDGHRVIHGVAGSGKTVILRFRCLYLAEVLRKPILVLCYNITLASRLRSFVSRSGVAAKVSVHHFHGWCGAMLRRYGVELPPGPGETYDRMVNGVLDAVAQGRIPKGQYGAILIDEGHDFKAEWLRLVVDMVDPETDSILLLYDDAQSIYRDRNELGFSLSSVGIKARGRTAILKKNYRNTDEILRFAYDFVSNYITPNGVDPDLSAVVKPTSAGRHGPKPVVKVLKDFDTECEEIADALGRLQKTHGVAWSDMCVVYSQRWMGQNLANAFRRVAIPISWLSDSSSKRQFKVDTECVKLMTMHSSKGLEFPAIAACGVGHMSTSGERIADEAKLLYVAMTRATENLLVTASRTNEFTTKLRIGRPGEASRRSIGTATVGRALQS